MHRKIAFLMTAAFMTGLMCTGCSNSALQTSAQNYTQSFQDTGNSNIDVEDIMKYLCSENIGNRYVRTENIDGIKKAEDYLNDKYESLNLEKIWDKSYKNSFTFEYSEGNPENIKEHVLNNISGKISGKNSKKAVILTANYDSASINSPSACNNASGVAAILKTAEFLKEYSQNNSLPCDVIFLLCGTEKSSQDSASQFAGAQQFINKISGYDEMYNIDIDSVGSKKLGKIAIKNTSSIPESQMLYDKVKENFSKDFYEEGYASLKLEQLSKENKNRSEKLYGVSEYAEFEKNNIPNILITQKVQNGTAYYQEEPDEIEDIDYEYIEKLAENISKVIESF